MKKVLFFAALALIGRGSFAQHVILVTIDGFRPDYYLDTTWHAYTLQELARNGVHAEGVNSVFPSITYPSHTTVVTGVQPSTHGVYYNDVFDPSARGRIYWNDSSIHAPTLWGAVTKAGMRADALLWPVSAEAPVRYDLPDVGSMGEAVREKYARPAGFVDTLRKFVFDGAARIEYGHDQNVAKIAAYVIAHDKPNYLTVHLFSVDHFSHEQGRHGDHVAAAIRDADSAVAIISDAIKAAGIGDSTVLIVTGDHGFLDVTHHVNPNVWLADAGLFPKARFNSAGGSAWLYLQDTADKAKVLQALPDSARAYFRIIDRPQMDAIGANPECALALSGLNGASFGNQDKGPAITPGKGGAHGYFPDFHEIQTGFIIAGPGIARGGTIHAMNLRDIAPTVARILGIDFPSAQGHIPNGVFAQ
ncbi:MAG TPA: ectonucleotide pyrophosphatase/phosphodiesterase [Dinghuibacter sp.]|uniref:alkaline phosphatase family protein n=1 Tax=Dinghuibacter sp. TaxID=2024697 RepID=UPI002D1072AD|nr:ectonucleotide pyrophosphatase/phosphodiesterase [Dinghuibacter sp.]HTJ12342.1 ectonucleotide pyrophosphatase/phosphodiesterase [Dinghuibacter sp.]